MSVKRYEWVACDEHSCHCDVVESAEGDMVDYEDYAALEARCAALAAEVYDLKHPGTFLPSKRETPALDAFLAEVRAHDLNAFIQHHSAELDAHIKNGGEQFDEKSVRNRDIIVSARLFREQIRKEAAQ